MGSAIAYLIASKTDCKVTLYDAFPESLKKSQATVEKYCKTSVDKGFITAEKSECAVRSDIPKLPFSQRFIKLLPWNTERHGFIPRPPGNAPQ